jgi:hypothetical protein
MSSAAFRNGELARRWEALKFSVAKADVICDMAFNSSCRYWQSQQFDDRKTWSLQESGDLYYARSFKEKAAVLIEGDCRENLTLTDGGLIHIYGDLHKTIEIAGHGEIVIGGSVLPKGAIEAEGIQHVFVGGDLNGTVRGLGTLKVSIEGNFGGNCHTGTPSTRFHVGGDVSGTFEPAHKASLLYLNVGGFMPYEALEATLKHSYTKFDASLEFSDRPPGFYPPEWARMENARHFYRWTIRATRTLPWGIDWHSPAAPS